MTTVSAPTAALSTEAASKRYGRKKWALRDVSIAVHAGEIVALLGPNGAGKSTLMRMWAGLDRCTKGRVLVGSMDAWRRRQAALAQIAYVGQGSPLPLRLTADELIRLAASLRTGVDRGGAAERLERMAIPADHPVGRLSGGQRSQVALTLALATSATVLLLDEPLASLDPLARRRFLAEALTACRASGKTLVMSSHVVADIDPVGTRVVLLKDGEVALDGGFGHLLTRHLAASVIEPGTTEVGRILGHDGREVLLLRSDEPVAPDRRVSSEELVLGYLAGSDDA